MLDGWGAVKMDNQERGTATPSPELSRRSLLKFTMALSGALPFLKASHISAVAAPVPTKWPEYFIRLSRNELFLRVTAVGYRESAARDALVPRSSTGNLSLIFTFPPQHFAETALSLTEIPVSVSEDLLRSITLLPSAASRVVFHIPHRRRLRLASIDLLAWDNFELVLPNLDTAADKYEFEVVESDPVQSTRLEIPWGIQLSPLSKAVDGASFTFSAPLHLREAGEWVELWTTALVDKRRAQSRSTPMEVLAARGFEKIGSTGTIEDGNLVISYRDRAGQIFPTEPTPLNNYDRMGLASSLSRRFPYSGRVGPPPIESARLSYQPSNLCVSACYAEGRYVEVSQLRLSMRGGWLRLDGKWDPFPGCALSGWVHSASLGRDDHVKVIDEGFLFPFGTPCELVVLSERIFSRDEDDHFVAPLAQQAFLQIPQPNIVNVGHVESPLRSLSVTTTRSPPLDAPPGGAATLRQYDFFLPTVDGKPFSFEHVGTDWHGDEHRSAMPMFYVSNKARQANGLIWEPGYQWQPTQAGASCSPPPSSSPDVSHTIPQTGDGLRVVDKQWALRPERFAHYQGALIALAGSATKGDTSQRVDWIEWTRGNVDDLAPSQIVLPFRPRARTMRIRIQSTGQLSGEPSSSIVTYRDVRSTRIPILDPEPTTDPSEYFVNVTAGSSETDVPYLYTLETRALVSEAGPASPRRDDQKAADLRDTYYGVSIANPIPTSLFDRIDNELRFGQTSSSEGVGALSVPDTHVSCLTIKTGVLGDATFNERRWSGYAGTARARIQAAERLDFAAFSRQQHSKLDIDPFQKSRTKADRDAQIGSARALMGLAPVPAAPLLRAHAAGAPFLPGLKLGDLFGADAQVIPGLRFADIFQDIALGGSGGSSPDERAASPLVWNVRFGGVEWLSRLLNAGATVALADLISAIKQDAPKDVGAKPLSLNMQATLNWSNDVFKEVDVGPAKFIPSSETKMAINASSLVDFGEIVIPRDGVDFKFSPGKPRISARASLDEFSVVVFSAIKINFSNVAFEVSEDGKKSFDVQIASVDLLSPLDFINQMSSIFGDLGGGLHLDLTPQRVRVSQTLRFPSTEGQPLFMGPAQITNLALSWFVTVPLIGRDVLAVGFGISSREKPLTIFVPPWYGGKAYALLEATTKGCRLVEVSMEYGALVPIAWGIATGQASLTAGLFYMLERNDAARSGKVVFRAFVKAAADLSVAGIIHFAGLIYIALSYVIDAGVKTIQGTATVSVSIKIGFFRVSYAFTAEHKETQGSEQQAAALAVRTTASDFLSRGSQVNPALPSRRARRRNVEPDLRPFGPGFRGENRAAFRRVMAGYRRG